MDYRNITNLLVQVSPMQSHAVASILGAAVADAAARPLHWIYDQEDLDKLFQENRVPEFWPESKSPFYTLPTGARSCYNQVMMAGLEAFIEARGEADLEVYKDVIRKKFGAGTEWQEALERRREAYSPARRKEWREPVPGPWLHGAVIHFLEHGEGDKENTEMDAFLLTVPHLVFHVDRAEVVDECVNIASLLSGQTTFVRCQAQILKCLLKTKTFQETDISSLDDEVRELTGDVFNKLKDDHVTTVDNFGNNCHLPGSFQGSLHAFLKNNGADSFVSTVRDVIRAGGCNCSRANYAGAMVGAKKGIQGIPLHWLKEVAGVEQIIEMVINASKIV